MVATFWRYTHFILAVFSALFLVIASSTGIILAIDEMGQKTQPFCINNLNEFSLQKVIPVLKEKYLEINELEIDTKQRVILKAIDFEGNEIVAYIHPKNGEILGKVEKKSSFMQDVLALHRSLFLHETGRIIVGLQALLLLLLSVSGTFLLIKNYGGLKTWFSKLPKTNNNSFYHTLFGRILLFPILIMTISAVYLSLYRFHWFDEKDLISKQNSAFSTETNCFQRKLNEVKKITFPLEGEENEALKVEFLDNTVLLNPNSGKQLQQILPSISTKIDHLSLTLHTGQSSNLWAIILIISCVSVFYFIYSGFAVTWQRLRTQIKNPFSKNNAEIVILFGSENGSTLNFANQIHLALLAKGQKSYLASLNEFQEFPAMQRLIVFAATFGEGDAPANANKFEEKLKKIQLNQSVLVSIVGFGSKSFADYCGFAKKIQLLLTEKSWYKEEMTLTKINDKNISDLKEWCQNWAKISGISLDNISWKETTPKLSSFLVTSKTELLADEHTFLIRLKPIRKQTFQSGDLLAIFPKNNSEERLYSVAKVGKEVQLLVRKHTNGLGSGFLYQQKTGSKIKAKIVKNEGFHFPQSAPSVFMISNGTGLAPFLGMIAQNKNQTPITLFAGFRKRTNLINAQQSFLDNEKAKNRLKHQFFAFSKEENCKYVTDLVKAQANEICFQMKNGAVIMICGSRAMQADVETILETIFENSELPSVASFKANKQIIGDCY